jgi:uncharacterized protein YcbK (DUF882 family)
MSLIRYVRAGEFACPCCGENGIDLRLVDRLDYCRKRAGIPFSINSGFRCESHNLAVSGRENSAHLYGFAADISAETSREKYLIFEALMSNGFRRIGIYSSFIHCDTAEDKPQDVIWHG